MTLNESRPSELTPQLQESYSSGAFVSRLTRKRIPACFLLARRILNLPDPKDVTSSKAFLSIHWVRGDIRVTMLGRANCFRNGRLPGAKGPSRENDSTRHSAVKEEFSPSLLPSYTPTPPSRPFFLPLSLCLSIVFPSISYSLIFSTSFSYLFFYLLLKFRLLLALASFLITSPVQPSV